MSPRERFDWIVKNRDFTSITQFTLRAGLAKATVTNQLRKSEKSGDELKLDSDTWARLAGRAQVSISWLMGHSLDPNGADVPPPPEDPIIEAGERLETDRIASLEKRVSALERKIAGLAEHLTE